MKITFGLAGIESVILAAFAAKRSRPLFYRDFLGALARTVLLCLPMIRFDLLAMLRDVQMAAQVKAHNPSVAITTASVLR